MSDQVGEMLAERARQDAKWGEQNHDDAWWLAILVEEVGEAAQAILESVEEDGPPERIRKEVVQTCAVALAWLQCMDRRLVASMAPVVVEQLAEADSAIPTRAVLKEEATWLFNNIPPDDLGMMTQALRHKWLERRAAFLDALGRAA